MARSLIEAAEEVRTAFKDSDSVSAVVHVPPSEAYPYSKPVLAVTSATGVGTDYANRGELRIVTVETERDSNRVTVVLSE